MKSVKKDLKGLGVELLSTVLFMLMLFAICIIVVR